MLDKAFELTLKSMSGEELTDDQKKYIREHNAKYEIVRYVYMEKMKHNGYELVNFQFSPGESFMDTPIIDVVNGLLKVDETIKNGDYEVVKFGDSDREHNPLHTGREKTSL